MNETFYIKMTNDDSENDEEHEENLKVKNLMKNIIWKRKTDLNKDIAAPKETHIYEELFDNYGETKPYDLSLKPKLYVNDETELKVNNVAPANAELNAATQQTFLEYLIKIQQNFVTNFIQYHANLLLQFQQMQMELVSKDEAEKENSSSKSIPSENNFLEKKENRGLNLSPPCNSSSNILSNFVKYSLYPNLLPNALSSSELPLVNLSNISLNNSTPCLSPDTKDSESTGTYADQLVISGISALKLHLDKNISSVTVAQVNTESNSLSEMVASCDNLSSKTIDHDLEETADFRSSNFQYKRKRIAFSAKQYELLQTTFEHNNFPEPADQQCIANQLTAPYRSIKMWFQNKRANARKKLMPGEKGSGRTVTGEKIPGDTDTRFYCDKCPSAFICQKYLNNHLNAHSLYTKNCPKCRVVFTHDCLLNTHLKLKCSGNKKNILDKEKDFLDNKKSFIDNKNEFMDNKKDLINKQFVEQELSRRCSIQIMDSGDEEAETDEGGQIASSILSHLSSTLPLLTLLQIQKKREENKKLQELSEGYASEDQSSSEEEKNGSFSKKDEEELPNLPPLIPTNWLGASSKFAILRLLLTNLSCRKESYEDTNSKPISLVKREEENENMNCDNTHQNIPHHFAPINHHNLPIDDHDEKFKVTEAEKNNEKQLEGNNYLTNEKKSRKRKSNFPDLDSNCLNKQPRRPKAKRLRRRTTVFTEAQHRILYLHFTHCNFPDPSMFRILSKLTALTPHVIKIWFQNERSRQRRQVSVTDGETIETKEKKPYKCRDCGVEFAMPAFLVKHCMRHIPTDNITSQARKCPICMVEFETQKLHSHFMASHNLSINTIDEESSTEKNLCYLCRELFSDLNALSNHKIEHLKDTQYGEPPQCHKCKTTFVNVLCLEAHLATHEKFSWDHTCIKCRMTFYDKILLESHLMNHCLSSSAMNNNIVIASPESVVEQNNQCIVSLLQQFHDESKHKLIEPKSEMDDNISVIDKISHIYIKQENLNSPQNLTNSKPVNTNLKACNISAGALPNLSLKVIPVKFIPVSSGNGTIPVLSGPISLGTDAKNTNISTGIATTKSLVTLISPKFVAIKKTEVSVKCESSTSFKTNNVPNLIPISDATFPFKREIEEEEENSKIADDLSKKTTETLSYTPYSSEYRKRRRTPTHFNSGQRDILEAYYKYDNFPDPSEQLHISKYLCVPYSVIKTWFQNTRKNHRKHLKELLNKDVSGPFECCKCRVCFVSKIYLDSHLKQHNETLEHVCQNCQLQFPHAAIYAIHSTMGCSAKKSKKKHDHMRSVSNRQSEECVLHSNEDEFVDRTYNGNLLSISNKSSNIKVVNVCHRRLKSTECFSNSTMKYHNCPKCCTKFTSPNMLKVHLVSEHEQDSEEEYVHISGYEPPINEATKLTCSDLYIEEKSFTIPQVEMFSAHKTSPQVDESSISKDPQVEEVREKLNVETNISSPQRKKRKMIQSEIFSVKNDSSDLHRCPGAQQTSLPPVKVVSKLKSILLSPQKYHNLIPCSTNPDRSATNLYLSDTLELFDSSLNIHKTASKNNVMTKLPVFSPPRAVKVKKKFNFTVANNDFLKLHYKFNNFPSSKDMNTIARILEVEKEQVAHWFQKQRGRERKGMAIEYQSPHQCKSCSSVFVHCEALDKHDQDVHSVENISIQFVCPALHCKTKFPDSILLQTHQMTHQEYETSKERDLYRHGSFLDAHYKENNFPSRVDVGYIAKRLNLDSLAIHWWFKEKRAKKVMAIENNLKLSPEAVASSGGKRSRSVNSTKECEVCLAIFLDEKDYERHLLLHSSSTSLICCECGLDFVNPLVLMTHMFLHGISEAVDLLSISKTLKSNSNIKLSFLQLQVLFTHLKQNNFPGKEETKLISRRIKVPMKHIQSWYKNIGNNKPFEAEGTSCPLCPSQFYSEQHMKAHSALHKIGHEFMCPKCDRMFMHETIRDTHSLVHYSGSGLKSRVKSVEREQKDNTKTLIKESDDVVSFSTSNGEFTDYNDFGEFEELENQNNGSRIEKSKNDLDIEESKNDSNSGVSANDSCTKGLANDSRINESENNSDIKELKKNFDVEKTENNSDIRDANDIFGISECSNVSITEEPKNDIEKYKNVSAIKESKSDFDIFKLENDSGIKEYKNDSEFYCGESSISMLEIDNLSEEEDDELKLIIDE